MLIRHASIMSGLPAPAGVTDSERSTGHYTMPNDALSAYLLQALRGLVCLSATGGQEQGRSIRPTYRARV